MPSRVAFFSPIFPFAQVWSEDLMDFPFPPDDFSSGFFFCPLASFAQHAVVLFFSPDQPEIFDCCAFS